jgi:hypothetical protein
MPSLSSAALDANPGWLRGKKRAKALPRGRS